MIRRVARTFQFLGTGTSVGIPVIGCTCPVCLSPDPRDNRTRSSALITCGEMKILVDTGPDLRFQALRHGIDRIDAVIYTHAHVDHVAGFDELRAFCWRREDPLPLYATEGTMNTLVAMFGWAFAADHGRRGYVRPDPRLIEGPFRVGGLLITPLPVEHGSVDTVGFLFTGEDGVRFAYIPDAKRLPPETMNLLRGVDFLAIDALRPGPHSTHLSLEESLEIIRLTGAEHAFLTHLSHDYKDGHEALVGSLPPTIQPAWDGWEIAW